MCKQIKKSVANANNRKSLVSGAKNRDLPGFGSTFASPHKRYCQIPISPIYIYKSDLQYISKVAILLNEDCM